jgi:hypothetical protein
VSSDNLYLIRRSGLRYGVSMEFASSRPDPDETNPLVQAVGRFDYPTPLNSKSVHWFDSEAEALAYAHSEYSEYGVENDTDVDSAGDTRLARIEALLSAVSPLGDGMMRENDHENSAVILHMGPCKVRVEGATFDDASALAGWFEALIDTGEDMAAWATPEPIDTED